MGKINVLSFEVANLIAAGEVVERPSSVLKELIENSIDAGATRIVAEIKRGGVSLIRVTDNGEGMSAQDLPVSLKRHATSKIHDKEDLASITTLGFRGEALAAISSVSRVSIITKTRDAASASMLTGEGGQILDISEVGAADGTTVVVEDLFFNVPARRKFLKKDVTEAMNVAALVEKVALSRPDISIQLLIDGNEKFRTSGDGSLLHTIAALWGKDFASKMLAVDGTAGGVRVHGYIGRSDNVRKNRNFENVFINGRYVKSLTVSAALEKAFVSYIAPECFPACALMIEMSPDAVDVNVHPSKLEVKFSDERPVFEAVYHTVREKLQQGGYRPDMEQAHREFPSGADIRYRGAFVPVGEKTGGEQVRMEAGAPNVSVPPRREFVPGGVGGTTAHTTQPKTAGEDFSRTSGETLSARASLDILERMHAPQDPYPVSAPAPRMRAGEDSLFSCADASQASGASMPLPHRAENSREGTSSVGADTQTTDSRNVSAQVPPYRLIGVAFDCYVMVESEGEMLVIDQHAAHERVLFEELKKNRERDGRVASQTLLLPMDTKLTEDECSAAQQYRSDLEAVGFSYTPIAGGVQLHAIPDAIGVGDACALFVQMCDELATGRGNPALTESLRRERALYQIACKAAIKGGRTYDESVIRWLVEKVLTLPNITVCPHGRPVAYRVSKRELDRKFDRVK